MGPRLRVKREVWRIDGSILALWWWEDRSGTEQGVLGLAQRATSQRSNSPAFRPSRLTALTTTVLGRNWSALPRIFASLFLNHPELLGTSKLLALARCVGSDVAFGDNYVWWPS